MNTEDVVTDNAMVKQAGSGLSLRELLCDFDEALQGAQKRLRDASEQLNAARSAVLGVVPSLEQQMRVAEYWNQVQRDGALKAMLVASDQLEKAETEHENAKKAVENAQLSFGVVLALLSATPEETLAAKGQIAAIAAREMLKSP